MKEIIKKRDIEVSGMTCEEARKILTKHFHPLME